MRKERKKNMVCNLNCLFFLAQTRFVHVSNKVRSNWILAWIFSQQVLQSNDSNIFFSIQNRPKTKIKTGRALESGKLSSVKLKQIFFLVFNSFIGKIVQWSRTYGPFCYLDEKWNEKGVVFLNDGKKKIKSKFSHHFIWIDLPLSLLNKSRSLGWEIELIR